MEKKPKLSSFGLIFEGAVEDYIARFKTIAAFSGISLGMSFVVPAIIAFLVVLLVGLSVPLAIILSIVGGLFYFVAVNFINGAFMYSQKDGARLKESIGFIKKNLWLLIGTALLAGLAVVGGFVALIIPGFIIAMYLSFSLYVFIDEGVKGLDALERSKEYVKGYFWPIVGKLSLYLLIVLASGVLVGTLEVGLGFISKSLGDILNALFSYFVVTPVTLCFSWRLYKDIKGKREDVASSPVSPKKAWLKAVVIIGVAAIVAAVILFVVFLPDIALFLSSVSVPPIE